MSRKVNSGITRGLVLCRKGEEKVAQSWIELLDVTSDWDAVTSAEYWYEEFGNAGSWDEWIRMAAHDFDWYDVVVSNAPGNPPRFRLGRANGEIVAQALMRGVPVTAASMSDPYTSYAVRASRCVDADDWQSGWVLDLEA